MTTVLRFATPAFTIEPSFWKEFGDFKVQTLKLSEEHVPLTSSLSPLRGSDRVAVRLNAASLLRESSWNGVREIEANGYLANYNTIEHFKESNKADRLKEGCEILKKTILSKIWMEKPSLLNSFFIVSFADLKRFKFSYLCGFPTLAPKHPFHISSEGTGPPSEAEKGAIAEALTKSPATQGWFCTLLSTSEKQFRSLEELQSKSDGEDLSLVVGDVADSAEGPAFSLRNLLAAIFIAFGPACFPLRVIALRSREEESIAFTVLAPDEKPTDESVKEDRSAPAAAMQKRADEFSFSGFERDHENKIKIKTVDLSSLLSPAMLAESGVDLNLRLLKWRSMPTVEVEKLKGMKCLLLGAGTLGCGVARALMGWGVRDITFVDNGKVSFSNPARQPLYTFEDALNGGRYKAEAAADALRKIFPGMRTKGVVLTIPMPSHPPSNDDEKETLREAVSTMDKLVDDCDALFLLTDSREARWLGAALGALKEKAVLTSAMGVDSYVCMRHGKGKGEGLGCYFCNDVVGIKNSQHHLSLDRQCTVSRPAVAAIASALVVELFVGAALHPKGPFVSGTEEESGLGAIPQQIRGYLSSFQTVTIEGSAFEHCPACSSKTLNALAEDLFGTVERVCSEDSFLEDLCGLTAFTKSLEEGMHDIVEFEDDLEME